MSRDEPTATRLPPDSLQRPEGSAGPELTPGTVLGGRFRIVSKLGAGGMGEVYRADDLRLGQPVALKFLPRRPGPATIDHLIAEARVGRELAHPNVCRLYDIVDVDGRTFIVMEYVDGEDLASLLRRIGRLPVDKTVSIARDLCAGLAAIHDRGIVHRDLKPGNVMIDGSGRARITDFGLARRPKTADGMISGTPVYMAPEQLAGEPASPVSDLYALGLVLHETLTGTRLFSAGSLGEILVQHRSRPRLALSETVPGLDAAVEATVRQCLEEDPAARPSSARAVLAALPGQDPLVAAVAAGETPSPEMVVAAAETGDLPVGRAWALLLAVLAGLAGIVALHGVTMLYRRAAPPVSPDALNQKAAGILRAVGSEGEIAHTAGWLEQNHDWLDHVAAARPTRSRWDGLAGSPHAFRFCFRSSPQPMVAERQGGENRITENEPPFTTPGMARVVLDSHGRLQQLVRIPAGSAASRSGETVDPTGLLALAGLDLRSLTTASPERAAPTDNDVKRAWTGADPKDGSPLRVEAAWLGGRPVWFTLIRPWDEAAHDGIQPWDEDVARTWAAQAATVNRVALAVNIAFLIVIPVGAWLLALRNLRRGRVDRSGTVKLVAFFFAALAAARLVRADHVPTFVDEWSLLSFLVAECTFWSLGLGVFYVAVEPFARRRWPRTLISWTRLIAGRFRDPIVGRDVLAGFVAGLVVLLAWHVSALAPAWLGWPPPVPLQESVTPLGSVRHVAYFLLRNGAEAVFRAFGALALLVLLRGVLRSQRVAVVVMLVPLALSFLGDATGEIPFRLAYAAVAAATALVLLLRSGLLSLCACAYLILTLRRLPLSFDPSSWYFGRSAMVLALLSGLSLWAFHRSLGGKPLFGRPLFED